MYGFLIILWCVFCCGFASAHLNATAPAYRLPQDVLFTVATYFLSALLLLVTFLGA